MRKKLLDELKRKFRPEFINRVDSIIVFRELSQEDIHNIVDIVMERVNERLVDYGLRVKLTEAAKGWLSKEGYDPEFGARPLRRVIQTEVEDRLSDAVLAGDFKEGDTVLVDVDEEENISLRQADSDDDGEAQQNEEEAVPTV
jgi:ATP-dependent Clp protease ATP-binding subunit ClpC